MTFSETIHSLEQIQGWYYVSRAVFLDTTGDRTLVVFCLERTGIYPVYGQHCRYTTKDLIRLLEEYHEENPEGTVTFDEAAFGVIKISFYKKTLKKDPQSVRYKTHTIEEARKLPEKIDEHYVGRKTVMYHKSLGLTRMKVQLDEKWFWYLSIFFDDSTGAIKKYCLDYEGASDSHYEFTDEESIRMDLYKAGDESRYIDEIFIRYVKEKSGGYLEEAIIPYVTEQFSY